jgi:hypothetical protein
MRRFGKSLDIRMFFALSPFRPFAVSRPFVVAASPRYEIWLMVWSDGNQLEEVNCLKAFFSHA